MTTVRLFRWLLSLALAGCAAEGGVSGTGISASVSGNIVQVDAAETGAALPFAVRVSVAEVPDVSVVADAAGTFTLRGAFAGPVTLWFRRDDDGTLLGPLPLEVPAGSVTVLENIAIDLRAPLAERVQPRALRQLDVAGHLELVECDGEGGGTLLVADAGRPARQFLVTLTAGSEVLGRDGTVLACADLRLGDPVRAEGLLRPADQALIASQVVVMPPRARAPDAPRQERFRGRVTAVDCARALFEVEQVVARAAPRRTVRLDPTTELRCAADARACTCADIVVGAAVQVTGLLFPRRPGEVLAELVVLDAPPPPSERTGRLARVDCARATLVLAADALPATRVALLPTTMILCGATPCRCADLRPRQRVRVEGMTGAGPPVLEAARVTVLPPQPSERSAAAR